MPSESPLKSLNPYESKIFFKTSKYKSLLINSLEKNLVYYLNLKMVLKYQETIYLNDKYDKTKFLQYFDV